MYLNRINLYCFFILSIVIATITVYLLLRQGGSVTTESLKIPGKSTLTATASTYRTKLKALEAYLDSLPPLPADGIKIFPCPIYYINLNSASTRDEFMQKQFEFYSCKDVHRIQAVDGRKHMPTRLGDKIVLSTLNVSAPEMGCLLSHIKAIAHAYMDGHDTAIILEDDAYFMHARLWKPNTIQRTIDNAPQGWCMLSLSCMVDHTDALYLERLTRACGTQFVESNYAKFVPGAVNGLLLVAYVINRKGMYNILSRVNYFGDRIRLHNDKPIHDAADSVLFDWVGDMYFTKPTTVFPHNDKKVGMVSDIQHEDDAVVMQNAALYVIDQYI